MSRARPESTPQRTMGGQVKRFISLLVLLALALPLAACGGTPTPTPTPTKTPRPTITPTISGFQGTQFRVYFTQHSNRGDVQVFIDDEATPSYIIPENGSSLVWQQSWTLPEPLVEGIHKVEFRNPSASSSTVIEASPCAIA